METIQHQPVGLIYILGISTHPILHNTWNHHVIRIEFRLQQVLEWNQIHLTSGHNAVGVHKKVKCLQTFVCKFIVQLHSNEWIECEFLPSLNWNSSVHTVWLNEREFVCVFVPKFFSELCDDKFGNSPTVFRFAVVIYWSCSLSRWYNNTRRFR